MEAIIRVAFDIPDYRDTRKMESEVSTIEWVAANTQIPVPRVLYYDPTGHRIEDEDGDGSLVGAPYMIMEKVDPLVYGEVRWLNRLLGPRANS